MLRRHRYLTLVSGGLRERQPLNPSPLPCSTLGVVFVHWSTVKRPLRPHWPRPATAPRPQEPETRKPNPRLETRNPKSPTSYEPWDPLTRGWARTMLQSQSTLSRDRQTRNPICPNAVCLTSVDGCVYTLRLGVARVPHREDSRKRAAARLDSQPEAGSERARPVPNIITEGALVRRERRKRIRVTKQHRKHCDWLLSFV